MFTTVTASDYTAALTLAQHLSPTVAAATTPAADMHTREDITRFLSTDARSGFAVSDTGELVGVFSTVKGRGQDILTAAIAAGATHLDCFDGFLTGFYAARGFRETHREANWTPGGPDVVFMALAA